MSQFDNVSVVKKANVYFDGTVLGFSMSTTSWWRIDWRRSTPNASDWQAFAIEPLVWERPGGLK